MDLEALLTEADWLRPLARRLARSGDVEADDLIQDSVEAALRSGGPSKAAPLRPWLRRVMLNLHAARQRTESRRRLRELRRTPSDDPRHPDDLVMRAEFRQAVASAVLRIREPYRRTLLWKFFEGWSVARIAKHDSVTPATVRSRIHRGLNILRADLGEHWGEDWRIQCLAVATSHAWPTAATPAMSIATITVCSLLYLALSGPSGTLPPAEERLMTSVASNGSKSLADMSLSTQDHLRAQARTEVVHDQATSQANTITIRATHAETGQPIPSAEIVLIPDSWESTGGPGELQPGRQWSWQVLAIGHAVVGATDESGICEISAQPDSRTVLLRANGLSGYSQAIPRRPMAWEPTLPHSTVEVQMWPDYDLDVSVLDLKGNPAPGVPVALGLSSIGSASAPPSWEGRPRALAFSNQAGIATLKVLGADYSDALDQLRRGEREPSWEIWHALPFNVDERTRVHESVLRSTTGSARLTIKHPGSINLSVQNCPDGTRAFLQDVSFDPAEDSGLSGPLGSATEGYRTNDGFLFQGVPFDRDWRLTIAWPAFSNQLTSQRSFLTFGPSEATPKVQTSLDLDSSTWMTGRLTDPMGLGSAHEADLEVFVGAFGPLAGTHRIAISKEGTFRVCLDGVLETESLPLEQALDRDPEESVRIRIAPVSPGYGLTSHSADAEAQLQLQELIAGCDLGEVAWGSAPLALHGVVVDDAGTPVRGVWARVSERMRSRNGAAMRWQAQGAQLTGDNGYFAIARRNPTNSPPGRMRVVVTRDTDLTSPRGDTIPLVEQEFEPGAGPVKIQLPAIGSLRIPFRNQLGPALRPRIVLRGDGRAINIDLHVETGHSVELLSKTIQSIPQGSYRVVLELHHGWSRIQRTELETVDIGREAASLREIDLGSLLDSTRFDIQVDGVSLSRTEKIPESLPLRMATAAPQSSTQHVVRIGDEFHLFRQALLELDSRDEPTVGWLLAPGFTPYKITNLWHDQVVQLQSSPLVMLTVNQAPPTPKDGYWAILLDWKDKPEGIRINPVRAWFGSDHRFQAQLPGWGEYQLTWQVLDRKKRVLRTASSNVSFQDNGGKEVTLELPAALQGNL